MNRIEFLKSLGISGAALFALGTLGCMNSCTSESDPSPSGSADFTFDLDDPSNSALNNNGGYVIKNSVVIARTGNGTFAAVTLICSHENNPNIFFDGPNNEFRCTVHGARFSSTGQGLNSNGSRGLRTYNTELNGRILRIFA